MAPGVHSCTAGEEDVTLQVFLDKLTVHIPANPGDEDQTRERMPAAQQWLHRSRCLALAALALVTLVAIFAYLGNSMQTSSVQAKLMAPEALQATFAVAEGPQHAQEQQDDWPIAGSDAW
eukprot:CAMPEP_0172723794 /NCGR_PEP_ID=MMETSP1074-20121228/84509_1 /TAXON_ID=2916 /ORGANISM="Ceratium fusus, Strain PA161109" /LENGTH=119 /DNA_ID=CAMNT_0013550097 /DNA_START=51 /DNA_END=407 /DNA_ORIENTATION=-